MSDMKRYGCVTQDSDRVYHFVRDPIPMQSMTTEEKRAANARNNRTMRSRIKAIQQQEIANCKKPDAMTIKVKRQVVADDRPKQSVEDWLKSGGKIDRSPTKHKFERLTKADIESAAARGFGGYQTPYSRRFSTIG